MALVLAVSYTLWAYIFLVLAVVFGLLALVLPMFFPVDGEDMNDEEPTMDVQNHQGDSRPVR